MLEQHTIKLLIQKALEARQASYSPYSNYQVGAALLTSDGQIYTGCNIENAAYSPTNCAERTAFFKAVSEGKRDFEAIAVVGGPKDMEISQYAYPCGVCRQVMMEFCKPESFQIIVAKSTEEYEVRTLQEFLPEGFGAANLDCGK
ncbi:MAG: cytidine deaminase [Lachnospiraceae bacterium]|nr:cytidine deaminase [Lachnospiraceae bacterium]